MYFIKLIILGLIFTLDESLQDSVTTIGYTDTRENYENLENLANLNYDTFNVTLSGDDEKEEDISNVLHKLPVRLRYHDIVTNISDAKTLGLTENLVSWLNFIISYYIVSCY